MNDYEQQANDFLESTGTALTVSFFAHMPHFENDKEKRDVYEVTLKNNRHSYTFKFGDSIYNTESRLGTWKPQCRMSVYDYEQAKRTRQKKHKKPSAYDILACLTKYDIGTFEDFCGDFGYSTDSKTAEKTYFAVQNEWSNIRKLFSSDELEQLAEIN